MQQWRIRIRGKQRQRVDIALLVQAVLALGRQFQGEATPSAAQSDRKVTTAATRPGDES